jgi:hypothetical protein
MSSCVGKINPQFNFLYNVQLRFISKLPHKYGSHLSLEKRPVTTTFCVKLQETIFTFSVLTRTYMFTGSLITAHRFLSFAHSSESLKTSCRYLYCMHFFHLNITTLYITAFVLHLVTKPSLVPKKYAFTSIRITILIFLFYPPIEFCLASNSLVKTHSSFS